MIIKTLTDEDFGLKSKDFINPRVRFASRGIVLDNDNKIAVLHKKAKNEYKLIGGGLEQNEDYELAFKREVLEETGCNVEIQDFLGSFKELKSQDNFQQISYVYVANVISNTYKLSLTESEILENSELLWLSLEDAIELIHDSEQKLKQSPVEGNMSIYHTKFIVRRDFEILMYYKEKYC